MKEIKILEKDFPTGKINLQQLSREVGTDKISASLGGGITKRQWVEVIDGESVHKSEEVLDEPSITILVPKEINAADVIAIVKAHNPSKTSSEEEEEKALQEWDSKLLGSNAIKSLIARIEALEKPKK